MAMSMVEADQLMNQYNSHNQYQVQFGLDSQGNIQKRVSKKSIDTQESRKYMELIDKEDVNEPQELEFESEKSEAEVVTEGRWINGRSCAHEEQGKW